MTAPMSHTPGAAALLTQDELMVQVAVRQFAAEAIAPRSADMDARAEMPSEVVDGLFGLGLMGMTIPESFGGVGWGFAAALVAVEELSRVDPSVALVVDVQNTLVVNALLRWGTPAQQQRWLPDLATRRCGAYALSEAASGSDAFALQTRARAVDNGYRLSGRKLWITNAREAGLFIVFATVDPALGHRGITGFIVPREAAGLSVGRKEDKLGIRASSTCEVVLDDCFVPHDQVLGPVGRGYKVAMETLNEGRIGIGAQMVGLADGALAHAVVHARERHQFGQPLAAFQAVQFQLARAATDIHVARLAVYHAARLREAGQPFLTEAAMCKLVASETAERVASMAVNLLGAAGYVRPSPVERLYRDAKIGQIYEGTSNLQLMTIARQMM